MGPNYLRLTAARLAGKGAASDLWSLPMGATADGDPQFLLQIRQRLLLVSAALAGAR